MVISAQKIRKDQNFCLCLLSSRLTNFSITSLKLKMMDSYSSITYFICFSLSSFSFYNRYISASCRWMMPLLNLISMPLSPCFTYTSELLTCCRSNTRISQFFTTLESNPTMSLYNFLTQLLSLNLLVSSSLSDSSASFEQYDLISSPCLTPFRISCMSQIGDLLPMVTPRLTLDSCPNVILVSACGFLSLLGSSLFSVHSFFDFSKLTWAELFCGPSLAGSAPIQFFSLKGLEFLQLCSLLPLSTRLPF